MYKYVLYVYTLHVDIVLGDLMFCCGIVVIMIADENIVVSR